MCFLESESDDIKRLSYPPSFFKFIEPSAKDGNSMYVCQVKDCPRMGKTLSTINNSRGNLRSHIKVFCYLNACNLGVDFIFLSALPQTTTATAVACQTTAVVPQPR